MSAPLNDGGPAFPVPSLAVGSGMTLSQYAAIKLRVPESGTDWLDDMIRKSNRDYFAAAALQGMNLSTQYSYYDYAKDAYQFADAMLKAREAK
jgi:hypothetical protein